MSKRTLLPVKFPSGQYSELDPAHILNTLTDVENRINQAFPESGLGKVSAELQAVGQAIVRLADKLRRPIWALRVLTLIGIVGLIAAAGWVFYLALTIAPTGQDGLMETLQAIESVTNELIFLTIGIIFFATLENRLKRRAAIDSLHRLRSFAHVIDMHQLTKDPNNVIQPEIDSDPRFRTPEDLIRYLDLCTDLLAINSKLAALHVQYFQNNEVLNNVSEVEMLSHELSRKIWQKIMIVDVMAKEQAPVEPKDQEQEAS
jgi:HAMP domain-containing protein